jgi:rubrerythrin
MPANRTSPANRTGAVAAPGRAAQMISAVEEFPATSEGNALAVAAVRVQYSREGADEEPDRLRLTEETSLLLDKLGERLAFERTGTRLYEALLSKHDAYGSFEGGPSRDDITLILSEELQHFSMLVELVKSLGADPTELTPAANVQLTASHGVGQVLVDPRTTLLQSLEAILMAELADNECWETLTGLARLARHEEVAERCEEALLTEQEHLEKVRGWLAAGQGRPEVEGEGVAGEQVEEGSRRSAAGGNKISRSRRGASGKRSS